jgi:RNA recognition motif-containing protein
MDIYVGNLSSDVTASDLREMFELFGRVGRADVVRHRDNDESRGFGFVGMPARSEGVCAVLSAHGRNLKGRMITATEVRPGDPVSGACRTRCHCRSVRAATGYAHPSLVAFVRERRTYGTDENGLE